MARRCAAGVFALVVGCFAAGCRRPPTEVLVVLDTDAPTARALTLTATVTSTAPSAGGPDGGAPRTWTRGGGAGADLITLPASFAIVPAAGAPLDGTVTLRIDALLAAGSASEPALTFHRTARFAFAPHQPTALRLFLPVACGSTVSGCTTVGAPDCTLDVLCSERMQTCGDRGECVAPEVTPTVVGPAVDPLDASLAPAPDAAPSCLPELLACGGVCVDPRVDPSNCGGCGVRCASGRCVAGACEGPTLAPGQYHACARLPDGTVECAGAYWTGNGDRNVPAPVPLLDRIAQLVVAPHASCALREDGVVLCWGDNDRGQLGDGTLTIRQAPAPVASLTDATQISMVGESACALRRDGTAVCWGENTGGQLGDGTQSPFHNTPTPVAALADVVQVAMSYGRACALRRDHTVACWGQLFDVPGVALREEPGFTGAVQLAGGANHLCARMGDGTVRCFGINVDGELGDGTTANRAAPAAVPGLDGVVDLVAGSHHNCVRRADGAVLCWGDNEHGEIGNGATVDATTPTPIPALAGATQLGLGWWTSCARTRTGAALCWGNNENGQLGDGTNEMHLVPTPARW